MIGTELNPDIFPYDLLRYNFWPRVVAKVSSLTYPNGDVPPWLSHQEMADALSGPQLLSKMGMLELVRREVTDADEVIVSAGWFGLLGLMLARMIKSLGRPNVVHTIDKSGEAYFASMQLYDPAFLDTIGLSSGFLATSCADVLEDLTHLQYIRHSIGVPHLAINPSCEHFTADQLSTYVHSYNVGTRFILSSTNMPAVDHVDCSSTVDDFAAALSLIKLSVKDLYTLDLQCNGWKRFYAIGVL